MAMSSFMWKIRSEAFMKLFDSAQIQYYGSGVKFYGVDFAL